MVKLLVSSDHIKVVLNLLPFKNLLLDLYWKFFLWVSQEFITKRMKENKLSTVLLVKVYHVHLLFQCWYIESVDLALSFLKAILFLVVLACFFNLIVRKWKNFGNPTLDFFVITTFEIIFKLTFFLFIVAKDLLACCLDYSCEVQVFFEI